MKARRIFFIAAASMVVALAAGVLLYSCGGGGGGGGTTSSGSVATYVTDSMSDYKQVIATINKIDLLNTGSGSSCNVFTGPLTLDIANLAGVMQLINVSSCPAVPYNRIHIEFAKDVALMDSLGKTSSCMFTSYRDEHNNPNKLACRTDTCTLDINGAVNVLVNQQNKFALDFNLKDFDVDISGIPSTCSVTMKVSPLHAGEMQSRHNPEAFAGLISGLSTTDKTFTLTRGNTSFSVLYSGITNQLGIDTLLQRAQEDQLRVRVRASQIDLTNNTITATSIYVKVEGTIALSSLDMTNHTFTVNYGSGNSIAVVYSPTILEGVLAEGVWVEVKLYGFDVTNSKFLAWRVEVETKERVIED